MSRNHMDFTAVHWKLYLVDVNWSDAPFNVVIYINKNDLHDSSDSRLRFISKKLFYVLVKICWTNWMQEIYVNGRKMFQQWKQRRRRRDIHGYVPIVINSNTSNLKKNAGSCNTVAHLKLLFIEKKLRYGRKITCSIELKSWKIDCASHQYSDSSPISGSLME